MNDSDAITIGIHLALRAKGRDGFTDALAEGNEDAVQFPPVSNRQYFSQRKFSLVGRFCLDESPPVWNPVDMCIDTDPVLVVTERDDEIGRLSAHTIER